MPGISTLGKDARYRHAHTLTHQSQGGTRQAGILPLSVHHLLTGDLLFFALAQHHETVSLALRYQSCHHRRHTPKTRAALQLITRLGASHHTRPPRVATPKPNLVQCHILCHGREVEAVSRRPVILSQPLPYRRSARDVREGSYTRSGHEYSNVNSTLTSLPSVPVSAGGKRLPMMKVFSK
ncbi:hypothetical protein E2C01_042924 [Portunus trituberculatus]|uniref:Uncharacterized protein n=1 Tax=Portunus trituberculatus TaxID=210409 RepID=A0A5B7FN53_PORTR|nr:hypothetical protein [Portunus trituberculatus]